MNMRIKVGDSVRRKFAGGGPNNKHFVEGQLYVVTDAVPVKGCDFQKLSFEGITPDTHTSFSSHYFVVCNPPENQAPLFEPRHFMKVFVLDPNTRFLRSYPLPNDNIHNLVQNEYGSGSYLFQEVRSDPNGRVQIIQVSQVTLPPMGRPQGRITYNPTAFTGDGGLLPAERPLAPVDPKRYGVAQRRIK